MVHVGRRLRRYGLGEECTGGLAWEGEIIETVGGCADNSVLQGVGVVGLGKVGIMRSRRHGLDCGFWGCCGYGLALGAGVPCRRSSQGSDRGIGRALG